MKDIRHLKNSVGNEIDFIGCNNQIIDLFEVKYKSFPKTKFFKGLSILTSKIDHNKNFIVNLSLDAKTDIFEFISLNGFLEYWSEN